MSGYPYPPAVAAALYARRVAGSLFARSAIRPDGSGVGMSLAELVDELVRALRENTAVQREHMQLERELLAELHRFMYGDDPQ